MVIIKLIGMGVVLVSSGLMGFGIAECMISREKELYNLADLINSVINELEFTLNPVGEIILSVASDAKGMTKELADSMCTKLKEGESVSQAWEYALKVCGRTMSLRQTDCNMLASWSSLFNAYEINEQINRLHLLKNRILQVAESAGNEKNKNGKLVRMMGIYGGILLCVIIF